LPIIAALRDVLCDTGDIEPELAGHALTLGLGMARLRHRVSPLPRTCSRRHRSLSESAL